MKDHNQFAPITTSYVDDIKQTGGPTFKQKETGGGGEAKGDQGWEADTMATGNYPTHTLTPVTLPDGSTSEDDEALSKGGKPKTEDGTPEIATEETPETPPAGTDQSDPTDPIPPTKFDLKLPPEFRKLPLSVATAVQDALAKCKDQTWQAALAIIDKAIEEHRKTLKKSAEKHRKEAPIKQQKAQAALEAKINAKITALEKLQEAAFKQMAATSVATPKAVAK
jgi:hypothetical protein